MDKQTLFELLEHSERLPALPANISEILAILSNPAEADIDVLAEKVSEAGPLNALVMNNLNSGYYQISRPVTTIRDAVVYLGMQTVQNLLIFFISRQLFPDAPRSKKQRVFDMPRYWRHVIGTSLAGSMLSSRAGVGDKYKLFTYGLIHDIGIALTDACLPELMDDVAERVLSGIHQQVAERAVLGGLTHSEIGAWLCRRWNIREDITNIVEHHHAPLIAKSDISDVRLIHVADVISTEYYEKLLGVSMNRSISAHIMNSLGITDEDRQAVADALPQEVENIHNYFIL